MLSGLLSMGIVTANYFVFNKEVVLIVDGQEIEVNSSQSNVQGVLDENEIDLPDTAKKFQINKAIVALCFPKV